MCFLTKYFVDSYAPQKEQHSLLDSSRGEGENELLPDQEAEGDGPGLLGKVVVKDSAVHL